MGDGVLLLLAPPGQGRSVSAGQPLEHTSREAFGMAAMGLCLHGAKLQVVPRTPELYLGQMIAIQDRLVCTLDVGFCAQDPGFCTQDEWFMRRTMGFVPRSVGFVPRINGLCPGHLFDAQNDLYPGYLVGALDEWFTLSTPGLYPGQLFYPQDNWFIPCTCTLYPM